MWRDIEVTVCSTVTLRYTHTITVHGDISEECE